jgi:hypothetical protein
LAILGALLAIGLHMNSVGHDAAHQPSTKSQPHNPEPHKPTTAGSEPDTHAGSSPVVPILIAIAALAAISIGAVVIRQRRRRARHEGQLHGRLL